MTVKETLINTSEKLDALFTAANYTPDELTLARFIHAVNPPEFDELIQYGLRADIDSEAYQKEVEKVFNKYYGHICQVRFTGSEAAIAKYYKLRYE